MANKYDHEVHRYWVNTILDEASDSLNNWERNFIENIKTRIDNNWPLSDAQEARLEYIYAEKTK